MGMIILNTIMDLALTAAPWLLLGLLVAGLIKGFLSEARMKSWVGGEGLKGISRAAVIGAPLPLCSCGAIPTGLALYRGGAGRGPSTAFMIGTPGIGVDSLAISYALLGPFMMVARAAGAVTTAVTTGLLVNLSRPTVTPSPESPDSGATEDSCSSGCCNTGCDGDPKPEPQAAAAGVAGWRVRLASGMRYAFSDLLDDISTWILAGLILAGALVALVPPESLSQWGSGPLAMLVMALIGVPLYICATAATPVAAGMLMAGVSPGTALVFLLAGPITSMATLGVLRREMGNQALALYMTGIVTTTIALGLTLDLIVKASGLDLVQQLGAARELTPMWLEITALVILLAVAIRPVRRVLMPRWS
ncbi:MULTISPECIES: SO_0444 family Cu/Zn efflux transporter [unclassified Ectothiorhodospira]|uniref:SO_0444 family Cu/Zn efflux transporter n=1 Tax=unclassified Ectothiorhodospira TaxID=2684909 RepID=UPI001EE968EA|nr:MULTISPECIES: SO_0444 family Cu/Zn efflux transporter [unclassified Ectothiorhodospira]MCG5516206.1 SO_0444 family Cu/Zn efflux transporter [Ectothiorhodospira sp. 9100]MCG5519641.1 SO_0444 family Cu/Zn efflux transporter [Ectothiorhodospira sp. 9905]